MDDSWKDNLVFNSDGLIPAIAQDFETKDVLMLAYMNKESLDKTIETNKAHYYSRSRKKLWLKGETSGHYQIVKNILYDCDKDSLLLMVKQSGNACHTGNYSCFYRGYNDLPISGSNNASIIFDIYNVIADRKLNPVEGSYTNYLLDSGIDKILKKVGEESAEVIIASKNSDNHEVSYEVSDLIYHLSVLLFERNITWNEIFDELTKRR